MNRSTFSKKPDWYGIGQLDRIFDISDIQLQAWKRRSGGGFESGGEFGETEVEL